VPDRAAPAAVAPHSVESATPPNLASEPAPDAQPTSFTTGPASRAQPLPLQSIAPPGLSGTAPSASEYAVKAAFLVTFRDYVQWPATVSADASGSVTIGILGDDPFGDALERRGQRVTRSRRAEDLKGAQIVFISKSESAHLPEILTSFAGANVLTVGEVDGFAKQGGIIEFIQEGENIRFQINSGAARRAGLQFNLRLLRLAVRVFNE
jgi:hypothetical protein